MPYQVFVSYSSKDASFIQTLKEKLKDAGFDVWIDKELLMPSQNWRDEIDNAIKASFALIVVLTHNGFESKYVTYEWAYALGLGKPIIPILLEATDVHERLEIIQYIDYSDHFSIDWNKLIQTLQKILLQQEDTVGNIPPFIRACISAFESYDPENRRKAIEGLKLSSHSAALEALIQGTEHHLEDVRELASIALAQRTSAQDKRAIPGLIEKIRNSKLRRASDNSLSEAVRLLALYDDPTSIDVMQKAFQADDNRIHSYARDFMIRMGELAIPGLVSIVERDQSRIVNPIPVSAVRVLGKIGGSVVVNHLLKFLKSKYQQVVIESLIESDSLDDLARNADEEIEAALDSLLTRNEQWLDQTSDARDDERRLLWKSQNESIHKVLERIPTQNAQAILEKWRRKQQSPQ